jgi:hypothetical protein
MHQATVSAIHTATLPMTAPAELTLTASAEPVPPTTAQVPSVPEKEPNGNDTVSKYQSRGRLVWMSVNMAIAVLFVESI